MHDFTVHEKHESEFSFLSLMTDKTPLSYLEKQLAHAYQQVPRESVWTHYKTPSSRYRVTQLCINEKDEEIVVIYFPVGEPVSVSFVRPLTSFLQMIEVHGEIFQRFSRVL